MMELTFVFILISVSLVVATPHGYGGYGVKGGQVGASARAEASSSAGAFGGVPVAVPLGAGYSGSFSKSSSSSSASSSASSSSSSFSYSGSGAGGFGLNGGVPNQGGCSTGNCQTAGDNGVPTPHGSSEGYNSANAAASAQAGAVSGLGCQGLNCDDNSDKCKSGQCQSKPHTGTTSIDSNPKKCTSGQCGSALGNGAPADYDSNDIRAGSLSSNSAHNANDQLSGGDKSSPAYNIAGSDCSHGKCGPSGSSNSKPIGHDFGNSYQGSSASNNQKSSSYGTGITAQYQKPSTHLETPKLGSKCISGNCNAGPAESGHETSPSSYNVPIHGAYENGQPKPSCDGVKCENQPKGTYSPTGNTVTKGPSSFDYPSSINCVGSSCFGVSANQATGVPPHTVSPYPTNSAGSNIVPGHIGHGKPSDVNKPSNDKLPVYTGGFGGPAGILSPNDFSAPTGNPSHSPSSTNNGKPSTGTPTGCNSPSCSGYPSASSPTSGPGPTGSYNPRPGGDIPSEKLPTYTGGFGGPAGALKPNEYDAHGTVTSKPFYANAGSPSYNTQQPTGTGCKVGQNCGGYSPNSGATSGVTSSSGYYGTTKPSTGINSNQGPTSLHNGKPSEGVPTGCNSPSCSGYPSASNPTGGPGPTGSYNPRPGGDIPSENLPMYTGGFGGPAGALKPNEYDVHGTVTSKPNYANAGSPSYNAQKPTGSTGCKVGQNCGGYTPSAGATSGATSSSGYYGTTKPNTGINSNRGPASSHSGKPLEGVPTGCNSPSCSEYPSASSPTSGSGPTGTYDPRPGGDIPSENLPTYTGGFGGPAGALKPIEYDVHGTVTYKPNYAHAGNTGCKVGENCGGYTPTAGTTSEAPVPAGYYGATKPNPGINSNYGPAISHSGKPLEGVPTGCNSPSCSGYPTASSPASGSGLTGAYSPRPGGDIPSEKLPTYTGGFGGPAGALKPNVYDVHGSVTNKPNYANAGSPSYNTQQPAGSTGCKVGGNCGEYTPTAGATAGTSAPSGYYGASKPNSGNSNGPTVPVYSGSPSETFNKPISSGHPGSSDAHKPSDSGHASAPSFSHTQAPSFPGSYSTGCKTGNCANYPTSGLSVGANAQSGSFGFTKPNTNVNTAAPTHPQYTDGFGGPSGTFKPNEHTYVTPSTGSSPTNCRTPNCFGSPSASADVTSGANAQPGSYGITKPSGGNNPSDDKPTYTGGFGGAPGLLKPNEYTVPVVSPKPNNKPIGVPATGACTSGKCDSQPHGSAPNPINASSGAHAAAAATAEASAVAYTGGFGGPPGVLAPYDDGKIGPLPTNGEKAHDLQIGGAHDSHNANIHAQHGTNPAANGNPPGAAGIHGNTVAQAGSVAGATAYAGAAAGASSGAHGYNPHGSHYNHEGNIKGGSPCGGGCGGSGGGAYNGGSTLDLNGGHGFPHGSTSGATAKSLSGANAFGVGGSSGSYASSSASAHASAGAYTKGGYGKR